MWIQAVEKDVTELEKLSKRFDFETNRDWRKLVVGENNKLFLLKKEDEIIGFSGLIFHHWNNTIQVSNIFVNPEYRRKGIGGKIISLIIAEAKKFPFRCLMAEAPSSSPVKKLYEKAGFRKCGYNDRYYSNTGEEICIWMSLDLK
jgi:ribosomal protein S18 acetylase RimI-like enzyme